MDTLLHLPATTTLYKTELSFLTCRERDFCVPSMFKKIPSRQRKASCNRRTRKWKYQLISLKSTSRIVEWKELIQSTLLGRFGSALFTEGLLSLMCIYLLEKWAGRIYIKHSRYGLSFLYCYLCTQLSIISLKRHHLPPLSKGLQNPEKLLEKALLL